jgi:hypothetical protein
MYDAYMADAFSRWPDLSNAEISWAIKHAAGAVDWLSARKMVGEREARFARSWLRLRSAAFGVEGVAVNRTAGEPWINVSLLAPAASIGCEQPSQWETNTRVALPLSQCFPAIDNASAPQIVEAQPDVEHRHVVVGITTVAVAAWIARR